MWTTKPLSIPLLGLVRFPAVKTREEDYAALGLSSSDTDQLKYLKTAAWRGFLAKANKLPHISREQAIARLKLEFDVFVKTGTVGYISMIYDLLNWCDRQRIARGPARGSCAASFVFFCLGITKVDPIRFGLTFTRFISEARVKPKVIDGVVYADGKMVMDVDIDISFTERGRVIDYVRETYPGAVAGICNQIGFAPKVAIKDVLKCYLGMEILDSQKVSDFIDVRFGKSQSIQEALDSEPKFREWVAASKDNAEAIRIAQSIEGLNASKGQHASGVFIGYEPLDGTVPVEMAKAKNGHAAMVTSYDMDKAALVGVKLDLLGLKNVTVIDNACRALGFHYDDIDINHPSIYSYIAGTRLYNGLFQISEGLTAEAVHKIKPRNIDQLGACLAISRPGALKYIDDFAKAVNEGVIKKIHPAFDAILLETGGILVYQEQINEILQQVYGIEAVTAEDARRAIGKKDRKELVKFEPILYDLGEKRGIPREVTKMFWDVCNASADYLFNKCLAIDTIVETPDGPVPIHSIRVGDRVRAFDVQNICDHYVTVKGVHSNEYIELYEVTFDGGRVLRCSAEHKLMTQFGSMEQMITCLFNRLGVIMDCGPKDDPKTSLMAREIVSCKPIGQHPTLDLEVDHYDHNFYANGVVVSNSHSASYAFLTAYTTYLKANHLREFTLQLLRMAPNETDPQEAIQAVIKECPDLGIKVLPPDLLRSEIDFSIDGDAIRFGLSSIKGISDSSFAKIEPLRGKTFPSKFDLFDAAKAAGMQINTLCSLIACGALGWGETSRLVLMLEAQTYNLLSDGQKVKVKGYSKSHGVTDIVAILKGLSTAVNEKGTILMPAKQLDRIRRDYKPYYAMFEANSKNEKLAYYMFERNLLGFSFTASLFDVFSEKVEGLSNLTTVKKKGKEWAEVIRNTPDGERIEYPAPVKAAVFIEDAKFGISKAKNQPYLKMMVADDTTSFPVMLYGSEKMDGCRSFNGRLPEEGDMVIVQGGFSREGAMIFAETVVIQNNFIQLKKVGSSAAEESDSPAAPEAGG